MAKEFHYFNFIGLGESVRYILYYTGQKFDDVRHEHSDWPGSKIKTLSPFGQLPLYIEGDRVLSQSLAIAKYVARDTDLVPSDLWEQAVLDSIVFTIYDYWAGALKYMHEQDLEKKYEIKKKFLDETIDFYFSRFEKRLSENGGFFIGKISWVEFVLCGIIETSNLFLGVEQQKPYPLISAVVEKIRNSPGVKEYIANRGPYSVPMQKIEYKGLELLVPPKP